MPGPKISEADFIAYFEERGPSKLAKEYDIPVRMVLKRRRNLERKHKRAITAPDAARSPQAQYEEHPGRLDLSVQDGTVIVGSDLHAWPGEPSTAFRALLKFIREFRPRAVILNGDVIDGSSISRHPPLGWENQPKLIEEIEAAQQRLHEVELAAPRGCPLYWPCGNHDARFSTRLATLAPEYARVHGTRLKDHFGERWQPCWSVWINGEVVVKHRYKSGIHATHNNTMWAGKSMVTGHLHSLRVSPLTDYDGTRFGVDCGTLAAPYDPQFKYLEDNPRNWRSGFCILTFHSGRLLWPELVAVCGAGEVEFRGKVIPV